ncbi:MAG: L-2-amino-thiazoline-4-carboxylic acid hydrolase [Rhizobiales bacterium]|nr:L-2-amino-thiazoline-4-carboxylic acid hydrolase [Hyphomicrobiales bacterium]
MSTDLPTLTKRKLQAEVIGPIFAEMVAEIGEEKAAHILDRAIRKAAINEGRAFAARAPGGKPSMADFIKLFELWTTGGSLEIDVLQATDTAFDFNVTRCRYAETYRDMGLEKIGHLLSCNRDGSFCEGYDPKLKLDRKQTIMEGHTCCTFRYSLEK